MESSETVPEIITENESEHEPETESEKQIRENLRCEFFNKRKKLTPEERRLRDCARAKKNYDKKMREENIIKYFLKMKEWMLKDPSDTELKLKIIEKLLEI